MNPATIKSTRDAADAGLLFAGAERAARLAATIAEVATQWAESAHAGLEAARDARDAAVLARLVVANAGPVQSDDSLNVLAAEAWDAVHRALEATRRVTLAVSAVYH